MREVSQVKADFTFTLGNLLSIIAMMSAVVIFVVSLSFLSSSNRDDIREIKESVKEARMTLNNLQTVVHSIDRWTALLEERTARNAAFEFDKGIEKE